MIVLQRAAKKCAKIENVWAESLYSSLNLLFGEVLIGHVRYINIQAWLRGFRVKIANVLSFFCPSIPKRDKENNTKEEV